MVSFKVRVGRWEMLPFNKLLRYRFHLSSCYVWKLPFAWDDDQFGWGCMQMSHSPDHLKIFSSRIRQARTFQNGHRSFSVSPGAGIWTQAPALHVWTSGLLTCVSSGHSYGCPSRHRSKCIVILILKLTADIQIISLKSCSQQRPSKSSCPSVILTSSSLLSFPSQSYSNFGPATLGKMWKQWQILFYFLGLQNHYRWWLQPWN